MATLLTCPHCHVEFTFDEWSKTASCPVCRRRVSFFAASGSGSRPAVAASWSGADPLAAGVVAAPGVATPVSAPATAGPPVATPGIVSGSGPATHGPTRYALFGKPLGWTRGWTVVVLVWAVAAVCLGAARVSMGHMSVLTPSELGAVNAVQASKVAGGATSEAVLHYLSTHDLSVTGQLLHRKPAGKATWYAFDRPWEHRTYVTWELPSQRLLLSWTVQGERVRPDAETKVELAKAAKLMSQPASTQTVPAVPGVIPSIPPGL